jgi:hypothetical protein
MPDELFAQGCSEADSPSGNLRAQPGVSGAWAIEFYFTPELHLKDERIIRDLDDAVSFAREQEVRPRVLDRMERAERGKKRPKKRPMPQHTPL